MEKKTDTLPRYTEMCRIGRVRSRRENRAFAAYSLTRILVATMEKFTWTRGN